MGATALRDRVAWMVMVTRAGSATFARLAVMEAWELATVMTGDDEAVRVATVAAVAKTYGCSTDWLLGLDAVGPTKAYLRRVIAYLRRADPATTRRAPAAHRRVRRAGIRSVLLGAQPTGFAGAPGEPGRWALPTKRVHRSRKKVRTMKCLQDRLVMTLEAARISQAELARVAGLNGSHVNDLCRGRSTNVTVKTLVGMARALGCSCDWLLGFARQGPTPVGVRTAFVAAGGCVQLRPGEAADALFAQNAPSASRRGRVRGKRRAPAEVAAVSGTAGAEKAP